MNQHFGRTTTPFTVASLLLAATSWTDAFSVPYQPSLPSTSTLSFSSSSSRLFSSRSGGGRAPAFPDDLDLNKDDDWGPEPADPDECRLVILQITDVYTLEHLAHFQTLLEQTKSLSRGATVVSVLTGDFLSPYLLASVDRGFGMMRALAQIPLDYLTWGNHEADQPHSAVCQHVRNFPGTWLNSNMLDHEAMDCQEEYDVIEVVSPNGKNVRKVGLCAVLTDDPAVYSHFPAPGAFGGATITDPWEALAKYERILKEEEGCDLVVPLQHLYVPDDHKTCQDFDFPVILSGHDHHRVDQVVEGTRLIKPGMNAEYATILELSWKNDDAPMKMRSKFVKVADWAPNPVAHMVNEQAYDVLAPLKNTQLAAVPDSFRPLSSNGSRESVCTMGQFICTLLRTSLNVDGHHQDPVDAVLLMGGNIRGNADYDDDSYFSLEALEAEVKSDEVIGMVSMPGHVLAAGIEATHAGEPIPGWMQYDQGIQQDPVTGKVTHVAGEPLDLNRMYRIATKISDLTNGQSWPLTEYYTDHPELLPPKGAYINIHAELMGHFATILWNQLWVTIGDEIMETIKVENSDYEEDDDDDDDDDDEDICDVYADCGVEQRLATLDTSGDGVVTVEDIQTALRDKLGLSIDPRESTLAELVLEHADTTGDGRVGLEDLESFCTQLGCDADEVPLVEELIPETTTTANSTVSA